MTYSEREREFAKNWHASILEIFLLTYLLSNLMLLKTDGGHHRQRSRAALL